MRISKIFIIRCINGGTCIDGVDSYTCSCPHGITGPNCECLDQADGEYECTAILVTDYYDTKTNLRTTTISNNSTYQQTSITKLFTPRWNSEKRWSVTQPITTTEMTETTERNTPTEEITSSVTTEEIFSELPNPVVTVSNTTVITTAYYTIGESRTESLVMATKKYEPPTTEMETSTSNTIYEQSTETEISEPTTQIYSIFDYDDYDKARTQYETTFDWLNSVRNTESTFTREYWNVTKFFTETTVVPKHKCENTTCLNGGTCEMSDYDPKVSFFKNKFSNATSNIVNNFLFSFFHSAYADLGLSLIHI